MNIWSVPTSEIYWTILKMDKKETQINRANDKKIDDYVQGLAPERWHRLCVKKKGRRELTSIEDTSIQWLKDYIKKSKERLITAASNSNCNRRTNQQSLESKEVKKNSCMDTSTEEIEYEITWRRFRKGKLKRSEFLLIAAQNNAIRTNYISVKIDHMQQNSKCRLCEDRDEVVNYIINGCSKLAQKEYKTRHDRWSIGSCARD